MDRDEVEVHKNAKRERGQYPAILNELAWSIKDLLYGIKSTEKMILLLVYFQALKRKPVIYNSDNAFRFSRFLLPSRQRITENLFTVKEKYFAKENFLAPTWTSAKCYCGNKTGNPERAVSLHLARSGGQSQSRLAIDWAVICLDKALKDLGKWFIVLLRQLGSIWSKNDDTSPSR